MKNKQKIRPHHPVPYQQGNTIVRHYEKDEVDEMGNKFLVKYCDYTNKKGTLIEKHALQVIQLGNENIVEGKEKDFILMNIHSASLFLYHFFRDNDALYVAVVLENKETKHIIGSKETVILKLKKESEKEFTDMLVHSGTKYEVLDKISKNPELIAEYYFLKSRQFTKEKRLVKGELAKIHFKKL